MIEDPPSGEEEVQPGPEGVWSGLIRPGDWVMLEEDDTLPPSEAESATAGWHSMLTEVGRETNEAALNIFEQYVDQGIPFILYLRNFNQEAYDIRVDPSEDDPRGRKSAYMGGLSTVETKLSGALASTFRVVAVANPSDRLQIATAFPRLVLPTEDWAWGVSQLVESASLIVLDLDSLASGVSIEIDLIIEGARAEDTVVILPPSNEVDEGSMLPIIERLLTGGGRLDAGEIPNRSSLLLQPFPRVAAEDEIQFDHLDESDLFADLLVRYQQEDRGESGAEARGRRAKLLNRQGVTELAEGNADAAFQSLIKALRLSFETNEPGRTADVLMNIGRALLELDQLDGAMDAFKHSGALSERYGIEAGFRRAMPWVATTHYLSGDPATARKYAEWALELERELGETEATVDALRVLLRICKDDGDEQGADHYMNMLEEARLRTQTPS